MVQGAISIAFEDLPYASGGGHIKITQRVDCLGWKIIRPVVAEQALQVSFEKGKFIQVIMQIRKVDLDLGLCCISLITFSGFKNVGKKEKVPELLVGFEPNGASPVFKGIKGARQEEHPATRFQEIVDFPREIG